MGLIRSVIHYDDRTAEYAGPRAESLLRRNYEKSFSLLWRAQDIAPWLGIRDHAEGADDPRNPLSADRLELIRKEFEGSYNSRERAAIGRIMSLIMHGEAYALYTSSTLLPLMRSTEAKLGMAMQVMEEAKHFYTLRQLLRHLGLVRPLSRSARIMFESIAAQPAYFRLFGMNVVLESTATSLFGEFVGFPGFKDILHQFHLDESRHVAFPQTYAQNGLVPRFYRKSAIARLWRQIMLVPAAGIFVDYRSDFEALDIDPYEFFGRLVSKITLLAEKSQMGFLMPRRDILISVNNLFNGMNRYIDKKYSSYTDYTLIKTGKMDSEVIARERSTFGDELFRGIDRSRNHVRNRNRSEVGRRTGS